MKGSRRQSSSYGARLAGESSPEGYAEIKGDFGVIVKGIRGLAKSYDIYLDIINLMIDWSWRCSIGNYCIWG